MANDTNPSERVSRAGTPAVHRRGVHATRAPTPRACGCGLPVAYDPVKQEFFCIGCGASKVCTCGRSLLGSSGRPVNVV